MRESDRTPEMKIESDSASVGTVPLARVERVGRSHEIDGLDLLLVLSRHKETIIAVTLAAAILAVVVSLLLPKMYTATTSILPPQQNQSSAAALTGQIGILSALSGSDLNLKNPSDLFVA